MEREGEQTLDPDTPTDEDRYPHFVATQKKRPSSRHYVLEAGRTEHGLVEPN